GVGRAIWFVAGADPNRAADLIDAFDESRLPDLYAGAGLACTYAGAANEAELQTFLTRAGAHAPQVAQGSVFASAARFRAGLVTEHTTLAAALVTGITPQEASDLADAARTEPFAASAAPSYELWRQRIVSGLAQLRTAP